MKLKQSRKSKFLHLGFIAVFSFIACKNPTPRNKRKRDYLSNQLEKNEKKIDQFAGDSSSDQLNLTCTDRKAEVPALEISALTKNQYVRILGDLLGTPLQASQQEQLVAIVTKSNTPEATNGFIDNSPLSEDKNFASSKIEIGEFFGKTLSGKINDNCTDKNCSWQKIEAFLENKGEAIYGFTFNGTNIVSEIKTIFEASLQSSNQNLSFAVEDALSAFFAAPYMHLRNFNYNTGKIDQFFIAQKISFFLMGSIPDDQLIQDAKAGKLTDSKVREQHVLRIMSDKKNRHNFAYHFISQFFRFYNSYDFAEKNDYNGMKASDVFNSAISIFELFLEENQSLDQFVSSKTIFANKKMAEIYGLKPPADDQLNKTENGTHLSGLLFHPITFLSTAGGNENTLYVYRGLQLMSRYLCIDLPPLQPADFKELAAVGEEIKAKNFQTIQEIIRFHRSNENCNICHKHIDGMGVAFENFDSKGNFRSAYANGTNVDTSGELLGKQYKNQNEMKDILSQSNTFKSCMVRQLNSFASQYSPFSKSSCVVSDVLVKPEDKIGFMDLVKKIVTSEQFILIK